MSQESAYERAGVDIDAGNRAVELMRSAVRSTYGPEVLLGIGAFGGLYDASRLQSMQAPVLVSSTDGVGTKTLIACALGCDGKWAIHPDQIETLNAVFSPSAEDIARARKVLDAYDEARAKGRGAASVDGRMIDAATVRMAKQLWDQAKHLGLVKP